MDGGREAALPEAKGVSMNNWGLLGHEWAVDMLKQHILHDSLRHAYLISGPAGVGKRTLALRLTQALNCLNSSTPAESCGKCRTCLQIESMQHPDLAVVQAEKEGGILVVEKVRAVRQSLVLKPFQGKYRVAIFLRFQEANANAANALLKTLEEAPAHAILLLTSETGEQLLPTIVSRCEVIRLRPVPVERLESALKEKGADAQTAMLVAHLSAGRPGAAFKMLADPTLLTFRNNRLDDLKMLIPASRMAKIKYAEKLTNRKKEEQERFRDTLLVWLSFWRDVLVCATGATSPLMNVDHSEEIKNLAKRLGIPGARRLVIGIESAIERLEMNVNPRLLAEVTLLDWPHG